MIASGLWPGALGGTRTPSLLIRRFLCGPPDSFGTVRDLGPFPARCSSPSGIPEGRSTRWLPAWLPVVEDLADRFACCGPSAFQAGHIPSCGGSCGCYVPSRVAGACCWSLLLLSLLLSTRRRPSCSKPTRTVQGMARVRSGQAPAWPLVSVRSVRRGSRVKRDFACAFTRHYSPVLVVLRSQSRLRLEGRTRTLSGPSPDQIRARAHAPFLGHGSFGRREPCQRRTSHWPVCGPIPESSVNCTPVMIAVRGTSNTMQPSPDAPGAMFSVPGNDWHSAALSSDDW